LSSSAHVVFAMIYWTLNYLLEIGSNQLILDH
jgi:hypothetical protein